jgi:hypothetical protein
VHVRRVAGADEEADAAPVAASEASLMILGYCKTCDKLVAIKPGPHKHLSRERYWYPVEHDDQNGKRCDGSKRGI